MSSGLNFLLSMRVHCSAYSEPPGWGTSLDLESCGNEFLVLLYCCIHEPVALMIFGAALLQEYTQGADWEEFGC